MTPLVAVLAPVHGAYNAVIGVLLFYQGWMGWKIRRARRRGGAFPLSSVKRHRKLGPSLPWLAAFGFAFGLLLIALDRRPLLAFPPHFILGSSIVLILWFTRRLGGRIKGPQSPIRTPHFVIGVGLLAVYVVQVGLGLGLLF